MPVPIIAAGIAGLTSGAGSAVGGKKGSSAANKQAAIQADQLAFSKQQYNTGMTAWQPAKDYWTTLLQGGPAATTAVGPYAAQIRTQGTAADRALSTLPMGGERNLARGQNVQSTYGNIQRLTEGVQPTAAAALGSLAGLPISASTATSGQAVGLGPSLMANQQATKASTAQGASGLGGLLYNAINKPKSTSVAGSIGTPPFLPLSQANPAFFPSVGGPG